MSEHTVAPSNLPKRLRQVFIDYQLRQQQQLVCEIKAGEYNSAQIIELLTAEATPVLIKGYLNETAHYKLDFDALKRRAGNHLLKATDKALLSGYSNLLETVKPITLREYIDNEILTPDAANPDLYQLYRNLRISKEFREDLGLVQPNFLPPEDVRTPSIWLGKGGTSTPMHTDSDDNFVIIAIGRKKIHLYPPSELAYLHLQGTWNSSYLKSPINPRNPDLDKFPDFAHARHAVIDISAGDLLFLPMGWAHFVENIENTFMYNYWLKNHSTPFYKRHHYAESL